METLELEKMGLKQLTNEDVLIVEGGCWDNFCIIGAIGSVIDGAKQVAQAFSEGLSDGFDRFSLKH